MAKYTKLWNYLRENCLGTETLTFDEIYRISGAPVDSSFLNNKSELESYGLSVIKVDMRSRTVLFARNSGRR